MSRLTAWRTLRLAMSVTLRSKVKFALLTALVAVSTLVFLGVSELSTASTASLDEALESDLGAQGTYRVELSPELGLTRDDALRTAGQVAAAFTAKPVRVAVRFPAVRPECPPYDQLGDLTAAILLDAGGRPVSFTPGPLSSSPAQLCLAGLVVPASAVRDATAQESSAFGATVVVDPAYEPLLRLSDVRPPGHALVITTGRRQGEVAELTTALDIAFADAAARASADVRNAVLVSRLDSGASVRAASDGIRLVYRLIGWGVLVVGGIGVLVAELIVLRDRTWFFGLSRAVGAHRWHVAWLVVCDVLVVVLSGLATAVAVLLVTQPWVTSFGRSAFAVDLRILRVGALPGLAVGLLGVILLAGAYPAWRATRLDPLDVLERR